MSDDDNNAIDAEIIDVMTTEEADKNLGESTAYAIANFVMREFSPGFIIVASPVMGFTDNGAPYPASCGIVINGDLEITKSEFAGILRVIAESIDNQLDVIEDYANEGEKNE